MRFSIILLFSFSLFGTPSERYFDLLSSTPKTHGALGDFEKGEIEILLHPTLIEETEIIALERLLANGINRERAIEWSRVGIIAEDQYLYWIRDAVLFPSGKKGTYDRILWKTSLSASPGVAIFPYLADGKILLNLNYRHATRSWELELPRGTIQDGETIRSAACRELLEETGHHTADCLLLGSMAVDSGILGTLVSVIACKAIEPVERQQEFSEAILKNITLSLNDLETAILKGFWDVSFPERTIRAYVRDPFLTYSLLQMKLRHWQDKGG